MGQAKQKREALGKSPATPRSIVFLVNWLILITLPLWGGSALLFESVCEARRQPTGSVRGAMAGRGWLWK